MKKERIVWIDQLKGFAFFTVILGHTAINETFKSWIYSFHMPLFLLITGFTLNMDKLYGTDLKSFFMKNTKRLILPYVWCQLLCILPRVIIAGLTSQQFNFKRLIFGIFCSNSRLAPMSSMPGYYVILLFFALLLLWALIKITNKNKTLIGAVLFILAAFCTALGDQAVIWHLNVVPTAALVIFIGKLLMEQYENNKDRLSGLKPWKYVIMCVILLAVGAVFWYMNKRISIHYNRYGKQYVFFLISMLSTSSALCLIFQKLKPLKILDYIGKNTLFYMLIHLPLINLLQTLLGELSERSYMNYVISVVIFFALVPVTKLAEKYAPFLLGRELRDYRLSSVIGTIGATAFAFAGIYYKFASKAVALTSPVMYIAAGVAFPVVCAVICLAAYKLCPVVFLCDKQTADRILVSIRSKLTRSKG